MQRHVVADSRKHPCETHPVLESVTRKLSRTAVRSAIDARLEAAADAFEVHPKAADTSEALRHEIARFVQHLASTGRVPPRRLTAAAAFGEALDILAAIYFTNREASLDDAEADVVWAKLDALHHLSLQALGNGQGTQPDPASGCMNALSHILTAMLAEMKRRHTSEYAEWVIARAIGPLDWSERCRLADAIRLTYGNALPNNMAAWPAGRLATCLPVLLSAHLGAIRQEEELFEKRSIS